MRAAFKVRVVAALIWPLKAIAQEASDKSIRQKHDQSVFNYRAILFSETLRSL